MAGVSSETVALIAAAGTAAGALIGSTSGGAIQFVLDRAREKRRAFAGARLVRLEISLTASTLRDAEHDAKWWVFFDDDPLPAWQAYAEPLSVRLTPEEFDAVTQAVREISHFSEEIRKIPVDDPNGAYWILSPKAVGRMKEMREHATAAFNALAKIAKDPEVVEPGKLLHDEQQPT